MALAIARAALSFVTASETDPIDAGPREALVFGHAAFAVGEGSGAEIVVRASPGATLFVAPAQLSIRQSARALEAEIVKADFVAVAGFAVRLRVDAHAVHAAVRAAFGLVAALGSGRSRARLAAHVLVAGEVQAISRAIAGITEPVELNAHTAKAGSGALEIVAARRALLSDRDAGVLKAAIGGALLIRVARGARGRGGDALAFKTVARDTLIVVFAGGTVLERNKAMTVAADL